MSMLMSRVSQLYRIVLEIWFRLYAWDTQLIAFMKVIRSESLIGMNWFWMQKCVKVNISTDNRLLILKRCFFQNMILHKTQRKCWHLQQTLFRLFNTTVSLTPGVCWLFQTTVVFLVYNNYADFLLFLYGSMKQMVHMHHRTGCPMWFADKDLFIVV